MSQDQFIKIKTALISVSDKTGLIPFAKTLVEHGVRILSTGGTARALRDAEIPVTDVATETGFPEIMEGRVKTLHPLIHGGILAKRDKPDHVLAMQQHNITAIDMVVVSLYPFAKTLAGGAPFAEIIENIDIGGPAMIRAAAKNHSFVSVVTDSQQYAEISAALNENSGALPYELRARLAAAAFTHTATYDGMISRWLTSETSGDTQQDSAQDQALAGLPATISLSLTRKDLLRYGENPHQSAALYEIDGLPKTAPLGQGADNGGVRLLDAKTVQGKALSYNNLNDADAAFDLACEFSDPAIAIIKHANPCGVGVADNIHKAWEKALAADPVSAFGGVVALNRPLDKEMAKALTSLFLEVVIAPEIEAGAAAILAEKPNLRILVTGKMAAPDNQSLRLRSWGEDGLLIQQRDAGILPKTLANSETSTPLDEALVPDLRLAWQICKAVKSNAIVIAGGGMSLGIGAGQMSRLDSAKIAVTRMNTLLKDSIKGVDLVAASDAFFPFPDALEILIEAGIKAVIQPGGSIQDKAVIETADKAGIAMVLTGIRHFRH